MMQTISALSLKSKVKNGIYVKGDFKKEISSEFNINTSNGKPEFGNKKAIVRNIFQSRPANKRQRAKTSYTIQKGDNKRLNSNGILRVYNINEPIDIPIKKLLGKWRNEYIGVTLSFIDSEWCIAGKSGANRINNPQSHLLNFRKFLKFAMA